MQDHKNFQVNLEGIIALLSENLYSNQSVFLREVLQNAVDAITARKKIDDTIREVITFDLYQDTLLIEDNGIGLSKEDIESFLSVIGQSSKRNQNDLLNNDFIGRFGIGLLSCFIVCDEITVITRKLHSDEVYKWVGKNDGTYHIKKLDMNIEYGTKVYLKAKEGYDEFFSYSYVYRMLNHYGGFLPYSIFLNYENEAVKINKDIYSLVDDQESTYQWMILGKEIFKEKFIDCIPIYSHTANINGVAYILPRNASMASKIKGKIYVKGMFVSDQCEKLIPSWAFFTKPLLNIQNIRLTASREDFYEDFQLEKIRNEIEQSMKQYFYNLYKNDPQKLEKIINIHYQSLKIMSAEEDELYKIMIHYFKFETTMGKMTLFEIFNEYKSIKYTLTVDDYKQIEKTAKAQNICVVNGGYINDVDLIEKFNFIVDQYVTEMITPKDISEWFDELNFKEMKESDDFLYFADQVLKKHSCKASIKKFSPVDIPVVYHLSNGTKMLKDIKETKEDSISEDHFILAELASSFEDLFEEELSDLCFNYDHPLIKKLIGCENEEVKKSVIEILYVQALMAGHHKITKEENNLFSNGINKIMDLVL
ncbi:HSP90 family protein [Inediibacterium massiliense]|uniref:HSP90 family protein n=1 Tax=Inediibacterium massiliense TaxID=1658111 RepID=UPI0006B46223|nr:HSP90 family protein [Inediibacterium massiliense]